MEKKRFYITTPIYYPSGNAHIGHAYCTTMCDIFARYKRERHFECYFLTGTDEHGQKIQKNAKLANKDTKVYIDEIVDKFKDLWRLLEISNDDFIRTTDVRHIKVVQSVFSDFIKNDDVYLGEYEGWYCTPCESFWTDTQVGEEHLCPDCNRPVEKQTESCYFFKTNKYLEPLMSFFNKEDSIYPSSKKSEMLNNFIKPGLEDLCVSRTSFDWGVPILENKKHVAYVWLDALFNYLSALGYRSEDDSLYKKFWESEECEIIHVIGADITRFHTIYWPEFLSALHLRLPDKVFVHGLLMTKDGKMSKSKGNVISPYPLVEKYGVDAVRYYFAREIVFGQDGQFTPEQFIERINLDLANNLGNLVNRSISMIIKYFDGVIPSFISVTPLDKELEDLVIFTKKSFEEKMDDLKITEAYIDVMNLLGRANKYIEETAPWSLAKDNSKLDELKAVMSHLAYVIFNGAIMLRPILVNKANRIFDFLGIDDSLRDYNNMLNTHLLDNKKVNKGEALFPRLDENDVNFVKNLVKPR